jgi:hypothetical protein
MRGGGRGEGSKIEYLESVAIRSDPYLDTLTALEVALENLGQVEQNVARWKWVVISMHTALQAVCVCALTRTDGAGAFRKDSEKKISEAYYGSETADHDLAGKLIVEAQVAPLGELLRRLYPDFEFNKGNDWRRGRNDRERSVRLFARLRNGFQHSAPGSHSIEPSGLPDHIEVICDLIRDIVTDKHQERHNRFRDTNLLDLIENLKARASDLNKFHARS